MTWWWERVCPSGLDLKDDELFLYKKARSPVFLITSVI